MTQTVKNLPAKQETWDQSLGWEDPLKIPWRSSRGSSQPRIPTPIFLPGEFHGQRSLVGYSPRGHKESDMTEILIPILHYYNNRNDWQNNLTSSFLSLVSKYLLSIYLMHPGYINEESTTMVPALTDPQRS